MRRINKDIKIAILTEDDPLDAIPIANDLNAVAINPNYLSLTRENVQEIKSQGFKVFTWTVNDTKQISNMRILGVDGVFTNYPERVN